MTAAVNPKVWPRMRRHKKGEAYSDSAARFNFVAAGRRSGKTLRLKAKTILAALTGTPFADPHFGLCAPTRDQAKRIFWKDIKAMMPREFIRDISESELVVTLHNGSAIHILGLDKPERVEGSPWDGLGLTEIANTKPDAWQANIRPALADRNGWADLEGVPEGRNHAFTLAQDAIRDQERYKKLSQWGYHHWVSAEVLPKDEIESAKRDMDPLTYAQEFEADFVSFQGSAYYVWQTSVHAVNRLRYNDRRALILALDFNVSPGVAAIGQEQTLPNGELGTGWIGEVWIERDSNTLKVMDKFLARYGSHRGILLLHGDATGGAKGSAHVAGSDWELVLQKLKPVFGARLKAHYPRANPSERSRVNAVNSRLCSALGVVRMMVDPVACPHIVTDFEGVDLDDNGAIDKKGDKRLSHLCFRGDTTVLTPAGEQRIDSLPARGLVQGWNGQWVAYEDARRTIAGAEIVAVSIQGHPEVYCTPQHQYLTASGEWICAKNLQGHKLCHWRSLSHPLLSRYSGDDGMSGITASTTTRAARSGCIGQSGLITMAQFPRAFACTTGTGIGVTMRSGIWNSWMSIPTSPYTPQMPHDAPDSFEGWPRGARLPLPGTGAQKVELGIGLTTRSTGKPSISAILTLANTAEALMRVRIERMATAPKSARLPGATTMASTTKTESAPSARNRIAGIATSGPAPAAGHAGESSPNGTVLNVRPMPRADAYCLRVPGDGCFALADGWVVSNSDAVGYFVREVYPVNTGGASASPLEL